MAGNHEKDEKVWIVFQTVSGREKRAKEALEKFIEESNLGDKVERVLVPVETVEKTREVKGQIRRVRIEKPVYRGYVFVKMTKDPELIDKIVKATGLRAVLARDPSGGYTFITLSPQEIAHIEEIVRREMERRKAQAPFIKGERVRIVAGPFKDMEGVVEEVYTDKKKIRVVIDLFGRLTPVDVDFLHAERITL